MIDGIAAGEMTRQQMNREVESVAQMTDKLHAAAEAHHRYVEATGDDNHEWQHWYARHMLHLKPEIDW